MVYKIIQMPYKRFLKIRGEPREIALGFALGLFVGMTPTTLIGSSISAQASHWVLLWGFSSD